jgi:hypothetical protein
LDEVGQGWIGLSEITAVGDTVYVVERDNQLGENARVKKLYAVPATEMQPAPLGGELPVVTKTEVLDFIPELAAFESYITDKVEGFAIDVAGNAYAVTDNDGVDDSSGRQRRRRRLVGRDLLLAPRPALIARSPRPASRDPAALCGRRP